MERKSAPLNIEKVTHVRASICAEGFHIIYIYINQLNPDFSINDMKRHVSNWYNIINKHFSAISWINAETT